MNAAANRFLAILGACSMLLAVGCSSNLETQYGERSGPGASKSINGTSVLGRMFEQAGHRVSSWSVLSPRLMLKADCIVWFPDDQKPPEAKVRQWLKEWLEADPERTLIYVGRDFDAEPGYWERVLPNAPEDQRAAIRNSLTQAKFDYAEQRKAIPELEDCEWFKLEGTLEPRQIRTLEGDPAWTEGIDPKRLEIELRSRLVPPESAEVLLKSGDDALLSRQTFAESQLFIAPNGAFLLNLPLVNHEHRKLASRLIAQIGTEPRHVVFLESSDGGPPIHEKDPEEDSPGGLEVFGIWPMNWILFHLAVVGILFCFARWPIFGRPWDPPVAGVSDFGRHVDALADVLRQTHDQGYAQSRLLAYRQITERDK